MDVDLLRPGNVPISPNTVLWFEFLLQPDLLEKHLKKTNPDPVPTDLLIKFLTLSVEPEIEDSFEKTKNFNCSKRHLSMKILALKIVAYWKWDLEMIESKLPLQLQYVLFRDFLCLSGDNPDENLFVPMMHHNLNFESLRDEQLFAISLYHRWTLHIIVNNPMVSKSALCSTTLNVESADEIMSKVMVDEGKSELILQKVISLRKETITIPTFHTISPPTEDTDPQQDWENGLKLPAHKFYSQIYYDLGTYKLYRELTSEAVEYFTLCKNLYEQSKTIESSDTAFDGYCKLNEGSLKGFCYACGVTVDKDRNLTLQLYSAIRDNYANIINILQADNLKRGIPLTYRESLELDLVSALASGTFTASRDLLFQIQTLNVIRRIQEGVGYLSILDYAAKLNAFNKGSNILTKALKHIIKTTTDAEKKNIKLFLLVMLDKCDSSLLRNITADSELSSLFSESELREPRTRFDNAMIHFPDFNKVEKSRENKIKLIGYNQLDVCMLERLIIKTYDPKKLKELIGKFSSLNGVRPMMKVYNKWRVSPSLCQAMTSLPNHYLQQYCYIVFAKVKELLDLQNFKAALDLIAVACEEVRQHKFKQLLNWEALYVNMVELIVMWPANNIDRNNLVASCKECLIRANQNGDVNFSPRNQIKDLCIITLLNIDREYLVNCNLQKRLFAHLDLSISLSSAATDIAKFKVNKKFSKESWDLIVPTFINNNSQRRQPGGDSGKANLTRYFQRLRDPNVVNIVLSLLSRIHNVLRDEPNLELYFSYAQLWPQNILNSNAYNSEAALEVTADVLEEALRYQPSNGQLLKLYGDINFVKGHYSCALKSYLEAIVAATDYFSRPVPKNTIEDLVYRRMVKCCMLLQCFIQAAVLCQFFDEVDYTTAFKCLSETMTSDASDCYYDCIWDVNILEFLISLHTKRNEHSKKQKAIEVVGLLELNSNNNEEIKREASNVRKTKFLRAMAKQYIMH